MPSKTNKKNMNKCKHIYVQGKNKGKRCNKNCREEYCYEHVPKRKMQKIKYSHEKIKEKIGDKTYEKLQKIKTIDDPKKIPYKRLTKIDLLKSSIVYDVKVLTGKIRGYNYALDIDVEETDKKLLELDKEIEKFTDLYNQEANNHAHIDNDIFNNLDDDDQTFLNEEIKNQNNKQNEYWQKMIDAERNKKFYCFHTNMKIKQNDDLDELNKRIKMRLERAKIKKEKLIEKYNLHKEIRDALSKRRHELLKNT